MRNLFYLLLIATVLNIVACSKDAGPGGNATIQGIVMHHTRYISFDTVYIKYNATNLPGIDPSNYDAHVYADANGNYKFTGLKEGNYYLYGIGWDTTVAVSQNPVTGGIAVKITSSSQDLITNVPVTEGN